MSPPVEPAFLALQTAVAGRFSLERELGRGGMGIVYLAHDVLLERPVAIKLLAPTLGARADMRRRFVREARTAAQCFHPHIVPIHAVEESGELAYFVMAYVQGETLAERLNRLGTLPADMVRQIGRDIGWALAYAHERGVVHRDVKPENILLEDGTERALITDFGIAIRDDPMTTPGSGEIAGTARFMAPEQALGEPLDGRADLYALGVTLFIAATGRHPFDGQSTFAMIARGGPTTVPAVRSHASALPTTLADAIDRCLARCPSDRFQSAAAFVGAIMVDPSPPPLPPLLRPVRASADAARSLLFWTSMVGSSAVLLAVGERFDSFGGAIVLDISAAVCGVMATAAAVMGAESVLRARRALRGGASPVDVTRSLSPEPLPVVSDGGASKRGWAVVAAGVAMAVLEGPLTRGSPLPDAAMALLESALIFAPPLLIGRGVLGLWRHSRGAGWIRARFEQPVTARLVRWAGLGITNAGALHALPSSEPTEIRLELAAEEILARLSPALRTELKEIPRAARALSREAESLRVRDAALADQLRQLRNDADDDAETAGAALDAERLRVRARLATTIAALESVRLDLLRLEAVTGDADTISTHLEVVRELQRRVDAAADVRALLRPGTATPTPA